MSSLYMYNFLCKKEFGSDTPKWVFNRGGQGHPEISDAESNRVKMVSSNQNHQERFDRTIVACFCGFCFLLVFPHMRNCKSVRRLNFRLWIVIWVWMVNQLRIHYLQSRYMIFFWFISQLL